MTDLLIKFELAFGKRRKFEIVIMMDYEFDDAYTNCFWFKNVFTQVRDKKNVNCQTNKYI